MAPLQGVVERARTYSHTPEFSKLWRYGMVSVVSTVVSLSGLYLFFRVIQVPAVTVGGFYVNAAAVSNVIATAIATIPSYYLNRNWVWGKAGKSHFMREVVPFWVIAFVSLVLSTAAVGLAQHEAKHLSSHTLVTLIIEGANFATYGFLWAAKFLIFNRLLFNREHPGDVATPARATASLDAS